MRYNPNFNVFHNRNNLKQIISTFEKYIIITASSSIMITLRIWRIITNQYSVIETLTYAMNLNKKDENIFLPKPSSNRQLKKLLHS